MRIIAVLLAMTISTAAIAQTAEPAPLAPGKPAGVHQAQMALFGNELFLALGLAAIAGGIALAASNHTTHGAPAAGTTTTTTTTTSTSP